MSEFKFSEEDNAAVKWCEDNYKELTSEYKKIMMEQYILIYYLLNLDFINGLKVKKKKIIKIKQNTQLCILNVVKKK